MVLSKNPLGEWIEDVEYSQYVALSKGLKFINFVKCQVLVLK